jgi:hypothetical protein
MSTKDTSQEYFKKVEGAEQPEKMPDQEDIFVEHKEEIRNQIDQESKRTETLGNNRLERAAALGVSPEKMDALRRQYAVDERLGDNADAMHALKEETKARIDEIPDDTNFEPSPESNGNTPEQARENIRESFAEKRGDILKGVLMRDVVSNGANLIPFAGGGKMLVETIAGKEARGTKLSGKSRIIHGAIGAGSLALDFTGIGVVGKGALIVGRSVGLLEKIGAKLAQKGSEKSARIFARTSRFLTDHPELTRKAEEYAEERARYILKKMDQYKKGSRGEAGNLAVEV